MAGLLDYLTGNGGAPTMDPRLVGLLGMANAMGQAYTPQPASRLPLAKPNAAYLLSQAAGGYGQGYGAGLQQQNVQAATTGQNIQNLNSALQYNLWAPYLGVKPLDMSQGGGASPQSMPTPTGGLLSSPQTQAPSPTPSQVAYTGGMPQVGAPSMNAPTAAPSGQSGQSGNTQSLNNIYSLPPPLLAKMGIPVPPELTTMYIAGIQPGDPRYQTAIQGLVMKGMGVPSSFGGDRAGVPFQTTSFGPNGQIQANVALGQFQTMTQGALTQVPAKNAEADFQQQLKNQNTLVDQYDPQTQTTRKVTQQDALNISRGIAPPVVQTPNNPMSPASPVGLQKDGSYVTSDATVIPAYKNIMMPSTGFQSVPSAAQQASQATYAETIKNWQEAVQPAAQTEQRFQAMATALKSIQSGAWTGTRVEIARQLEAAGMEKADADKLAGADPAQAQIILKNNFGAALGILAAAKMGRITQNEIAMLRQNLANPDLTPEANLAIISQGIGLARQQQALARDWGVAQQIGYPDPYSYQDAWMQANPLQKFIDKAQTEIGPLKGMGTQAPPQAIKALQMNPTLAPEFDAKYGTGSSGQYLKAK